MHALVLSFALAIVATGCGGGDSKDDAARDVKRFGVLRSDLPDGYKLKTQNSSTSARKCVGEAYGRDLLAKLEQLGVQACASATYRKVVHAGIRKTNTPGSTVIRLKTAADASRALPALRSGLIGSFKTSGTANGSGTPHGIPVSGLGDETLRGVRFPANLGALGGGITLYAYFWRRNNVIVFVGSTDILGDFSGQSVLKLAKKIDARIAAAGHD